MMYRLAALALSAILLAACTTTGGGAGEGAQPATLAQPASNEQQQRAKTHTELGSLYYAPAFNLLGMTHMLMSEPKLAEENFQKALKYAPGDPEISNNYGWFLCQNGREQQSIAQFLAAARNPLYSAPTKAYTNAGICAQKIKDDKSAEDYLLTALRHAPSNTLALFSLAELSFRLGRYPAAKQWIGDIERLMEPTAEVLWLAVRTERKLGNRDAEARYANQLRRRFPGTPEQRLLGQGQYE